jgi:hypothetical protein
MEDHEPGRERRLVRLLRELPREGASPGFTPRVIERLEAEGWQGPRASPGRAARLAVAAAAVAAASLGMAIGLLRPSGPPAAGREESVARPAVAGAAKGTAPAPQADAGRLARSTVAAAAASGPAERGSLEGSTPAQGRAGAETSDAAQAHQLLRELRDESGRLERELRDLRRPRREVLYLGGDDELDLVVDLSRVREGRRVLPAAHHHGTL